MSDRDLGPRKFIFVIFSIIVSLIIADLFASAILIYYYRWKKVDGIAIETSSFSLANLAIEAASRLGFDKRVRYSKKIDTLPYNFFLADPQLGYALRPGQYELVFSRSVPKTDQWQILRTKVTIGDDGTRWTGPKPTAAKHSIYIFGDSNGFGYGVNDEQTFAFLLQEAMPSVNVRLYAAGGYSLTQALLNFGSMKNEISKNDIIILTYGDAYNTRQVVAPSHLRELERWNAERHRRQAQSWLWPKFSMDQDGSLKLSYIQQNCALNRSYCNQPDPPQEEMTKISAALVNQISRGTEARVYLLQYDGSQNDPVLELIDKRVTLISALPSDFDYFVRDDVEGFDSHPGPYWHYAIFSRLKAVIGDQD